MRSAMGLWKNGRPSGHQPGALRRLEGGLDDLANLSRRQCGDRHRLPGDRLHHPRRADSHQPADDQQAGARDRADLPDLRRPPRHPLLPHADPEPSASTTSRRSTCAPPGTGPRSAGTSSAPGWPSTTCPSAAATRSVLRGAQLFEDMKVRERQALEINDNIVQGLSVAKYALDQGAGREEQEGGRGDAEEGASDHHRAARRGGQRGGSGPWRVETSEAGDRGGERCF